MLGKRINDETNLETGKPYNFEDIYDEIKDVMILIRSWKISDTMQALGRIKAVAKIEPKRHKT